MEKINFESLSKTHKIFFVFSFFAFLIIFSSFWRIILAENVPSAPSNLNYGTVTSYSVPLYWTDNANNEDKFIVQRKLTTDTNWDGAWSTQITGANITSYTDNTVTAGNTYDYGVQACLSGTGCSELTYRIGILVPGGSAFCTSLNLTLNDGKTTYTIGEYVNYTWTCSPGVASNVSIWLQKPDNTSVNYNSGSGGNTRTLGFSTSNLTPGLHTLKACFDPSCTTVDANQTFTIATTTTTPPAPSNFNYGTTTSSSIPLTWTDNANNEDKFNIERKLTTATDWSNPWSTQITTVDATTYIDTSVTAGNTYDYRVQACLSGTGCSGWTYLIGVLVPTNTTQTTQTTTQTTIQTTTSSTSNTGGSGGTSSTSCTTLNLTLNDGKTPYTIGEYVNYTWTCSPGIASNVSIWLQKPDNTSVNYNSGSGGNTRTLGFSTSNLTPGLHTLKACFDPSCTTVDANQSFSVVSTAISTDTTQPTQPTQTTTVIPPTTTQTITRIIAPSNLTKGSISETSILLTWTDNADNEDKFNVERKLTTASFWSGARFIQIPTTNTTSYTDTTVTAGTTYDYRVQACLSGTGCSGWVYLTGVSIPVTTQTSTTTVTTNDNTTNNTYNPMTDITITRNNILNTITNIITPNTTTNDTTISPTPVATTTPTNIQPIDYTSAPTEFSSRVQDLGRIFEERRMAIENTREQLMRTINERVANIIKNAETYGRKIDIAKINTLHEKLRQKVGSGLLEDVTITPKEISNLKTDIDRGIDDIQLVLNEDTIISSTIDTTLKDITSTLNTLSEVVSDQTETINQQGGDLLYKDSNKDGISDYDSIHVYLINPTSPSPVSSFEGKNINASEKILLGFDPTQSELVQVEKEQPVVSSAPIVPTYQVKEVALTEKKEVVLKGQALPNSFVTIYIYSTPIMVTVKTDSKGEWQYVLDKELEDGDHTVYTATVNNSGNIIAKSQGYLFTKTAEAASLKDIPAIGTPLEANRPGLLEGNNLYVILSAIFAIIILLLILIGVLSKKETN